MDAGAHVVGLELEFRSVEVASLVKAVRGATELPLHFQAASAWSAFLAADAGAQQGLGNGDTITVTFDKHTNQVVDKLCGCGIQLDPVCGAAGVARSGVEESSSRPWDGMGRARLWALWERRSPADTYPVAGRTGAARPSFRWARTAGTAPRASGAPAR